MRRLPDGQPVRMVPGSTYRVVARVKANHSPKDLRVRAEVWGAKALEFMEGPVRDGYREIRATILASREGTIPWKAPPPLSVLDGSTLVEAWTDDAGTAHKKLGAPSRSRSITIDRQGRRVRLLGAADAYAQASTDLGNQVETPITVAGDAYLKSGSFDSAVQAYQAAGMAGAMNVGPEIDGAGQPAITQPLTQLAWQINATLAAINSAPKPPGNGTAATQADAVKAQGLAKQMLALYQQAIAAGRSGQPVVPPPAPRSTGSNLLTAVVTLGIVGGVTAGAWAIYKHVEGRA